MSKEKKLGRGNSIHNPFPASLASECEKASQILDSFINPRFVKLDVGIPRKILANAKGLVIITSLRAGFLGSGRFGSGLIISRLPDGSWSTPSALMTGGGGVGGLIGFELTDFVFVITTDEAVRTLAISGSLTVGGNVSMAAGPVGRTAEAAGTASKKGVAGMLSYSKTRGIYAGVSLEGGVLGERADANKKMYGRKVTAKELLRGDISPPPETASLMRVLNSPYFSTVSPVVSPAESAVELPSNDIHEERAELPSQRPKELPQGIPELDAQASSQRAELGTGPAHEIFELSSGQPQGTSHELDSAVSSSSQFLTQPTSNWNSP
ncbi:hypothetical protein N7478_010503 [Penicillium angulare]|uniref:uncharacterized protein n=1 Tax=Penicillium angulare TaxID=116970 RepID=UPI0025421175|nr:uncharacterized protein N7478_010503 [Penicillium angulare]KAJ5267695.1 hypothetical protein N7478_010503 [Penicillium angulare]